MERSTENRFTYYAEKYRSYMGQAIEDLDDTYYEDAHVLMQLADLYLRRISSAYQDYNFETEDSTKASNEVISATVVCFDALCKLVSSKNMRIQDKIPPEMYQSINDLRVAQAVCKNYEIMDILRDICKIHRDAEIHIDSVINVGMNTVTEEFHERAEDERKAVMKLKKKSESMDTEAAKKQKDTIRKEMTSNAKSYITLMKRIVSMMKHRRFSKLLSGLDNNLPLNYPIEVMKSLDMIRDNVYMSLVGLATRDVRNMVAATKVCSDTIGIQSDAAKYLSRIEHVKTICVNHTNDGFTEQSFAIISKMMEPIHDACVSMSQFIDSIRAVAAEKCSEQDDTQEEELTCENDPSEIKEEGDVDMVENFNEEVYDDYYAEASLTESYMFNKLNDKNSITNRIADIIRTGTIVEKNFIEDQYGQIERTRLSPLVDKVLSAYDNDDIVLIYNKTTKLTVAIPFIVMQFKGKFRALIFIGDFSGITKDGTALNIEMKKLYTLMEAALVGLTYYTKPQQFQSSSVIAKLTAGVYAEMGLRILNREFALSLEKNAYDMTEYTFARFYLQKVLGMRSTEVIDSYARGICKSPDNTTMELIKSMYEEKDISSLEEMLAFVTTLHPKMERLTFRYFFERWISSYMIGSVLAIDNFPYLYYVMLSVLLGSFMINNTALNDPIKNMKGMQHFHGEIARII